MKTTLLTVAGLLLTTVVAPLRAQPASPGAAATVSGAPVSQPASKPATQPRYQMTVPPGFKLLTINGRKIVVEPADEGWVTTALGKVAATTKPSTQPAQLLARLGEKRSALLTQLAKDLALADLTSAAATYDNELTKSIRQLDDYRPPVFYLVITPERLAEIMRNGWSDQRFYYNRAADAVTFNPAGALNIDRLDDVVFPAIYDPKETAEKKAENLTVALGATEASVAASVDIRARQSIGATLAQLVHAQALEPLKLNEDQTWFALGVASWYSAKYAAEITGEKREDLNNLLTFEHPANPLKTSAIDLLHPTDLSTMREEALPAYFDTVRRKSTRAIKFLVEKGKDDAIAKSLVLIRDKKPLDGPTLVKAIQDATTVDVTPQLVRGI
ncbi:MAG: hypothetical protein ABIP55_16840 [Tepidisphaeraceae bacterium]